jgi:glucose/arabinose dehydrogenase
MAIGTDPGPSMRGLMGSLDQLTAPGLLPTRELRLVGEGLAFPTSLAFDEGGAPCVAESGLPFDGAPYGGRVLRLESGEWRVLVGDLRPPVNGLCFHRGEMYVSEGGPPGRIIRVDREGRRTVIVDNLPGPGNYHTNMVAFGPDGKMYFSQGAMTNSGVVGLDAYEIGWLRRLPHAHDLPGYDVVLAGRNFVTPDPLCGDSGSTTTTGAFMPFGTPACGGQRIAASVPCTAGVMRCNPDGSDLEVFAWGLRNAYGLGFLPDGRLLAIDQGADDRGSRPMGNAPDLLFEIQQGRWYGWPDFIDGEPVTHRRYTPERGGSLEFVLANHAELPPPTRALFAFPPHAAAVKFDVAPASWGRLTGQIFVALFGDERPMTAPPGPSAGRHVVRVDPGTWTMHEVSSSSLHRPIDVRFHPTDGSLFVLDFGEFEMRGNGAIVSVAGTGAVWTREY